MEMDTEGWIQKLGIKKQMSIFSLCLVFVFIHLLSQTALKILYKANICSQKPIGISKHSTKFSLSFQTYFSNVCHKSFYIITKMVI